MKKLRLLVIVGLIVSCVLFSTACTAQPLDTPKRLSFDDETYRLSWEMVEAAMAYKLDVNGVEYESTRTYFDAASALKPGDYTVKIMAKTELEGYSPSGWSKPINIRIWPENGLKYTLINGGTEYAIQRADSLSASGDYVIDSTYRGKPVTQIGDMAFVRDNELTGVTIPDSITYIGEKAFQGCSALKSVTMSDKVTYIGSSAFYLCKSLESFKVPAGVTSIGTSMFSGCLALKSVDFSAATVTYLGENAFHNTGLETFIVPDTVVSVGEGFLRNNRELKSVKLGNGLQALAKSSFSNCIELNSVDFGSSLVSILDYAFSGCKALVSVKLPESMRTIGVSAFSDCETLASVELGNGVSSVGSSAFKETKVVKDAPGGIIYVDRWAVGFKDSEEIVLSEQTRLEFAEGTVGVADSAFYSWSKSASGDLIFPYDVIEELRFNNDGEFRHIGALSFAYLHNLVNLNLYSGIKTIGGSAFTSCTNLTTARFANTLEYIGNYAFYGCTKLGTGSVPTTGTFAGEPAISVPASVTTIGIKAFDDTRATMSVSGIRYVGNKNNAYLWAVGTKPANEGEPVIMPDGIILEATTVGIANSAFSGVKGTENMFTGAYSPIPVELPDTLKYIGTSAFAYSSAGTVKFPTSPLFDSIPNYCFYKCTNLSSAVIPQGIKNIMKSSFYFCESLTTLELPDTVEYIGMYAFFRCKALSYVSFSDNIHTIDSRAFYQCEKLTSVDLPSKLTTIGMRAFYMCESLSNIEFGDNIETIGDYAFSGCKGVESVVLPDSVKSIGNYAFYNCLNNAEIVLNDGLESIGKWAFCNNGAVTSVVIPQSVTYVGEYAFRKCVSLKNILVRGSLDVLSRNAFYYSNAVTVYIEGNAAGENWHPSWNISFRPVVYGCEFSEDGRYVKSITVSTIDNPDAIGPMTKIEIDEDGFEVEKTVYRANFSEPMRAGYVFGGYATEENGTKVYDKLTDVPSGTKVYVVWTISDGSENK